ncbi:MAG TPA: aspartate aminotransferase family protein, partial [Gammaproteobacteria bacterium]|nr:aspartate aminotransferase family protein [Gammaproteobacteria bacterium]
STFGGNPFACSVASTVLEVMQDDNLAARAARQGEKLTQMFAEQFQRTSLEVDIRGQGLMIGLDLKKPCTELVQQALEKQLLINVTSESVIRLLPPLVIEDEQLEQIVNCLFPLIHNHLKS